MTVVTPRSEICFHKTVVSKLQHLDEFLLYDSIKKGDVKSGIVAVQKRPTYTYRIKIKKFSLTWNPKGEWYLSFFQKMENNNK